MYVISTAQRKTRIHRQQYNKNEETVSVTCSRMLELRKTAGHEIFSGTIEYSTAAHSTFSRTTMQGGLPIQSQLLCFWTFCLQGPVASMKWKDKCQKWRKNWENRSRHITSVTADERTDEACARWASCTGGCTCWAFSGGRASPYLPPGLYTKSLINNEHRTRHPQHVLVVFNINILHIWIVHSFFLVPI